MSHHAVCMGACLVVLLCCRGWQIGCVPHAAWWCHCWPFVVAWAAILLYSGAARVGAATRSRRNSDPGGLWGPHARFCLVPCIVQSAHASMHAMRTAAAAAALPCATRVRCRSRLAWAAIAVPCGCSSRLRGPWAGSQSLCTAGLLAAPLEGVAMRGGCAPKV